jgi:hypothetical protein
MQRFAAMSICTKGFLDFGQGSLLPNRVSGPGGAQSFNLIDGFAAGHASR